MENSILKRYVPNLDELFNATKYWIQGHQGKKGYIDTDYNTNDVYALAYDDRENRGIELRVIAVRVKNDEIEVALDWDYNRITTIDDYEEYLEDNDNWYSLRDGKVYYTHTLFELAKSIEKFL